MIKLPTPHHDKLIACLKNPSLPSADKERVQEAINQYQKWIQELNLVENSDFTNSKILESHLGYVCAECKTNLDKTMFQEVVATSRDLKIAVPSSLYFLVCESFS